MILVGFAFLAGIVTIASPCIFPLLPIILSGSTGHGRARPYGIVLGFVVTFTLATLTFSVIVRATGVSPNALRWVAVVTLAALGLVMLVPRLQLAFEALAARVATAGHRMASAAPGREAAGSAAHAAAPTAVAGDGATDGTDRGDGGFGGGVVVGTTLGLVWTPCVGPIMASVITLAAAGAVSGLSLAVTLAYALGTGIPMLLIILGGRALFARLSGVKRVTAAIQRTFAVLMIVVAAGIALNLDRQFQVWVLDTFPGLEAGIISIEENRLVEEELDRLQLENE